MVIYTHLRDNMKILPYNYSQRGMSMAVVKVNITLDPDIHARFLAIAEPRGMKLSPWLNQQMKKFVEEEEKKIKK